MGFVGLRPKMYSFTISDGKESEVKKAKGISKSDCLYNCELERHTMN